ncbi:MAG: GerW family sporulation protein [Clostridia bacterium]|nr:GerW family sporulation protein [Clostridia bacterium]
MSENNIQGIMDTTMEKVRAMVDADTVVGTPVKVDNMTLIPISKVSFGLASGGSDFPSKTQSGLFGGGGGAGVTITPIAFLAVSEGNAHLVPIYNQLSSFDKAVNMAPELIDKVKSLFTKKKDEP